MHGISSVRRRAPTEFIPDIVDAAAEISRHQGPQLVAPTRRYYCSIYCEFTVSRKLPRFLLRGRIYAIFATLTHLPSANSRPGALGASTDRGRIHLRVVELGFESTCIVSLVYVVSSARLTDMEGENYRMTLLANSHPRLVMTQTSQNSAPVSFDPLSSISVAFVSVNPGVDRSTPSSPTTGSGCYAGATLEQWCCEIFIGTIQRTRRGTQHDHDAIVSMGADAQAADYAVP